MRPVHYIAVLTLLGAATIGYAAIKLGAVPLGQPSEKAVIGKQSDGTYFVPTGQTIAPAGHNFTFAGRPVDMALNPDGKTLAVMLGGETKLFDITTNSFKAITIKGTHNYSGIAWSKDGSALYTSGHQRGAGRGQGSTGVVQVTSFNSKGEAVTSTPIAFPFRSRIQPNVAANSSNPAGIALSPDGKTLYVSLFNNHTIAVVDLKSYDPQTGGAKFVEIPVGSSPERLLLSPDGSKLYVANRGGKTPEAGDTVDEKDPVVVDPDTYKVGTGTLSVVDAAKAKADPEHAVVKSVTVGLEPVALAFSPDGRYLYCANANSESISVLTTANDTVVETIPTSPAPGKLGASCPNGVAIAPDGKSLYVTLAGDNAVEILALGKSSGGTETETRIAGLIPTAWFPLHVELARDGKTLFVANCKGIGSEGEKITRPRANNGVATPQEGPGGVVEKGNFVGKSVYAVMGSLGVIAVPDARTLAGQTVEVARNNRFDRMQKCLSQKTDPFWSRFKHVILVIKENRTYDQVFGDIPVPPGHIGGDPGLVMFGQKITPNQHALAKEFGLFDNLYCSGAISSDGHHWLNEAFASDYSERAMNNYPRAYPCCGADPLVYAGNQFIWQAALQAGKSFRNYGEFAPLPSIRRHSNNNYNDAYDVTADQNEDVVHCNRILEDLKKPQNPNDPNAGLPQFTTIWFPNDHTSGTSPGTYTPEADVADNDLAVGKLVDFISHNKRYWQDEPTLIIVVEDDAQGGLDHVEGHRTVGLVISPYTRRGLVVSTNFNQMNILRTIEAILDIKPLNQFDAAALPMRTVFQDKPDFRPYDVQKNQVSLDQKNPPLRRVAGTPRRWAEVSATLDFSAPDKADPELLTQVLWHHTHGDEPYPVGQ